MVVIGALAALLAYAVYVGAHIRFLFLFRALRGRGRLWSNVLVLSAFVAGVLSPPIAGFLSSPVTFTGSTGVETHWEPLIVNGRLAFGVAWAACFAVAAIAPTPVLLRRD